MIWSGVPDQGRGRAGRGRGRGDGCEELATTLDEVAKSKVITSNFRLLLHVLRIQLDQKLSVCDIFLNILSNIDKYLEALKKVTEKVNARKHLHKRLKSHAPNRI